MTQNFATVFATVDFLQPRCWLASFNLMAWHKLSTKWTNGKNKTKVATFKKTKAALSHLKSKINLITADQILHPKKLNLEKLNILEKWSTAVLSFQNLTLPAGKKIKACRKTCLLKPRPLKNELTNFPNEQLTYLVVRCSKGINLNILTYLNSGTHCGNAG